MHNTRIKPFGRPGVFQVNELQQSRFESDRDPCSVSFLSFLSPYFLSSPISRKCPKEYSKGKWFKKKHYSCQDFLIKGTVRIPASVLCLLICCHIPSGSLPPSLSVFEWRQVCRSQSSAPPPATSFIIKIWTYTQPCQSHASSPSELLPWTFFASPATLPWILAPLSFLRSHSRLASPLTANS